MPLDTRPLDAAVLDAQQGGGGLSAGYGGILINIGHAPFSAQWRARADHQPGPLIATGCAERYIRE